ncbi:MAG: histidinol-phosphatase [Ruminococcus sp.]|nr:histidinol-phosphatase [Ruminococcus sp.]
MTIDFHSHILPGIDDGSRNVKESVQILDNMAKDGVDIVVATPHFYCTKTSIHRFLDRRADAYERLKPNLKPEHPKILLGAEVLYNSALVGKEALKRLAIEGTSFLLLEMPYSKLDDEIINGVDVIASDLDVKVIVAHIERYLNFTSFSSLERLMNLDVMGQINAESLVHMRTCSRCVRLIKKGYVQLLGTDIHRIDRGNAYYSEGTSVIKKKIGNDFAAEIERNGKMVLKDRTIDEIVY